MKITKELSQLIIARGYNPEEYTEEQILQLYVGLEENLDITQYINPKYDWKQMHEIREGLSHGLDMALIRFNLERKTGVIEQQTKVQKEQVMEISKKLEKLIKAQGYKSEEYVGLIKGIQPLSSVIKNKMIQP